MVSPCDEPTGLERDDHAYLEADRLNLGCEHTRKDLLFHDIWRYQRLLRRLEYSLNCGRGQLNRPVVLWLRFRLARFSKEIGIYIKPTPSAPGWVSPMRGPSRS